MNEWMDAIVRCAQSICHSAQVYVRLYRIASLSLSHVLLNSSILFPCGGGFQISRAQNTNIKHINVSFRLKFINIARKHLLVTAYYGLVGPFPIPYSISRLLHFAILKIQFFTHSWLSYFWSLTLHSK